MNILKAMGDDMYKDLSWIHRVREVVKKDNMITTESPVRRFFAYLGIYTLGFLIDTISTFFWMILVGAFISLFMYDEYHALVSEDFPIGKFSAYLICTGGFAAIFTIFHIFGVVVMEVIAGIIRSFKKLIK